MRTQKKQTPDWRKLALAGLTAVGMSFTALPAQAQDPSYCNDVEFIFARGSGEPLGGANYTDWLSSIAETLSDSNLKYTFHDLGSDWQLGYNYPAIEVSDSILGYAHLIGAYVSSGESYAFGRSVRTGADSLARFINDKAAACPDTKYVLGGYSQGAMVAMRSLAQIDPDKIIYVATFGDPKLYLPEGAPIDFWSPKIPDACRGKNLSPYRAWVPDCWAYEGILEGTNPYQPENYDGKIGTWCNKKDIMCSSGLSLDNHLAYIDDDVYQNAAQTIYKKLRRSFRDKFPKSEFKLPSLHDVLFLFDATGSMLPRIEQYKTEAQRLASQVIQAGGRIALYSYRDEYYQDHAKELCDFSCSEEEFAAEIKEIDVNGGGDSPESALAAIMAGLNHLDWRFGALKTIVLLTDNIYHDPDRDEAKTTLEDVVQRSLEIDPVNVYVITPPRYEEDYAKLTALTNGKHYNIDSSEALALSTQEIYHRPVAKLGFEAYYGELGDELTFDASESYGFGKETLQYDWDLDGDGKFELTGDKPTVSATYPEAFNNFVQVRVHDERGSSTMSAKVEIANHTNEPLAQITKMSAVKTSGSTAKISFATNASQVLLSLGDLPVGFVEFTGGSGELTINDIEDDLAITLTPYSHSGKRGVSRSLQVPRDFRPVESQPSAPSSSDASISPSTPPAGGTNSGLPSGSSTPITESLPSMPVFSKAPNTGCYDERLTRTLH